MDPFKYTFLAHDGMAHAQHALGQSEQAGIHWRQALEILARLGVDHTDDQETTVAVIRQHLSDDECGWPVRHRP